MTYFETRMSELGITPENNKIVAGNNKYNYPKREVPIFTEDTQGNIKILLYTLDRQYVIYPHPKSNPEAPNINNNREQIFSITRLKNPIKVVKNGKEEEIKYLIPKNAGTFPFFPPGIIDKYEKGENIETLFLTEGVFKCFSGYLNGLDIIGLSSITHFRGKDKGMYQDIIKIITKCKVKNIVILHDGDCFNISIKAFENGEDIRKRPYTFFSVATSMRELLKDYLDNRDLYYCAVNSENIDGKPKGLDDLFITQKDHKEEIVKELTSYSKGTMKYFYRELITHTVNKLNRRFHLNDLNSFYDHWSDVLREKEFVFNGTKYKYDSEKNNLEMILAKEVQDYFRVGDEYYEYIRVPDKYGNEVMQIFRRKKETIKEDLGKSQYEKIVKYKAFCNVPNHVNYSKIINNCYNLYTQIEHEPEQGTCPNIKKFIRHVFGKKYYRMALDYLKILYTMPYEGLPILCLVSREQNTGKSTFFKLLKAIFGNNALQIGNSDLSNDFNGFWTSKLVIGVDETFIEKKMILEKIKSLATSDNIVMNKKGRDQEEVAFFGKFLLMSNNEDNFIHASDEDTRFWVIKVPVIENKDLDVKLVEKMIEEIPALLHFLSKRKMQYPVKMTRFWFPDEAIKTEALGKVIEQSRPAIQKELKATIREMFFDFKEPELFYNIKQIQKEIFNNRYDKTYIEKTLEAMKISQYTDDTGKKVQRRYKIYKIITKLNLSSEIEFIKEYDEYRSYPFVFKIEQFLNPEEIEQLMKENKEFDKELMPF